MCILVKELVECGGKEKLKIYIIIVGKSEIRLPRLQAHLSKTKFNIKYLLNISHQPIYMYVYMYGFLIQK